MSFYSMDDFSLQVSHIDLPPPRPRSRISSITSIFSDKSLETSYIELPSLPPKPYSMSQRSFYSEKSLEVSHIDLPSASRQSRSSMRPASTFDSIYDPFDDDEKALLPRRGTHERSYGQSSQSARYTRPASSSYISSFCPRPQSRWDWDESDFEDEDEDSEQEEEEYRVNLHPRYSRVFYNSLDEKPLPPLPREARERTRSLMASLQKPLPPLPVERR